MKRILLISDTHGYLEPKLLKYIKDCDEVWHAGDIGDISVTDELQKLKPLRAVWGNIDGNTARLEFKEHCIFMCEDRKVFITHIGGYPGKYNPAIKPILHSEKPDIFICGHSHILKVMFDKTLNLLHLNPGSSGKSGFHKIKTALMFEIDGIEIKNLNIIELGPRI